VDVDLNLNLSLNATLVIDAIASRLPAPPSICKRRRIRASRSTSFAEDAIREVDDHGGVQVHVQVDVKVDVP